MIMDYWARKFIYINSFFAVSILQIVMILAENSQLIVVITITKYYDSTVNKTWTKGNYQIIKFWAPDARFLQATSDEINEEIGRFVTWNAMR